MNPSFEAPLVSIITPAYNEAANLPILYKRLAAALNDLSVTWEWIVIDDHSRDATIETVRGIAANDSRVRGIRLSRNCGSHTAIGCGLDFARGSCVAILAADLQDSPETLGPLIEKWRSGAQVVWAVRESREGESRSTIGFSRLYYYLMRRVAGLQGLPATGADFWLMDRRVVDALQRFGESNVSLLALITWMGFRQERIFYVKQSRLHGSSGWSLEKKLKLVVDSITSFTYRPIRFMSYVGFVVALFGFLYAGFIVVNALTGKPVQGWSSLMVVVLVLGGLQMAFMGVLGEYIWRALDEARRRPHYLIEDSTDPEAIKRPL